MVRQEGLFSPPHAPQRLLNATLHFQSIKDTEVLTGVAEVIY